MISFDDAMDRYGNIVNSVSVKIAKAERISWNGRAVDNPVYQDALIWIWRHLDDIERWEAGDPGKARGQVIKSLRHHCQPASVPLKQDAHAFAAGAELASFEQEIEQVSEQEAAARRPAGKRLRVLREAGELAPGDRVMSPLVPEHGREAEHENDPKRRLLAELWAAYDRLDEDQQELFNEYHYERLTPGQIAERRGVHHTAIGQRLERLHRKIRDEAMLRLTGDVLPASGYDLAA